MLVEEIHPGLLENGLGLFISHAVGKRDRPPNGVEPIAERLAFLQVIDRKVAFIAEQPGKDRWRIPVTADGAFHDSQTEFNHGTAHRLEVHIPVARLFADQ